MTGGSYGSDRGDDGLLGCDAVWPGKYILASETNMLPPS